MEFGNRLHVGVRAKTLACRGLRVGPKASKSPSQNSALNIVVAIWFFQSLGGPQASPRLEVVVVYY